MDELIKAIKEGKEFAVEQAPDICNQILIRGYLLNGSWLAVAIIFLIIGAIIFSIGIKSRNEGFVVVSISSIVISTIIFVISIHNILTIYFAPKIYIIEFVTHLIGRT